MDKQTYIRGWCEGYKQAQDDMAAAIGELAHRTRIDGAYIDAQAMRQFEADCVGASGDARTLVPDDYTYVDDGEFNQDVDGGSAPH